MRTGLCCDMAQALYFCVLYTANMYRLCPQLCSCVVQDNGMLLVLCTAFLLQAHL